MAVLIIFAACVAPVFIMGLFIRKGKGLMLLAGYNTMPPQEREKINKEQQEEMERLAALAEKPQQVIENICKNCINEIECHVNGDWKTCDTFIAFQSSPLDRLDVIRKRAKKLGFKNLRIDILDDSRWESDECTLSKLESQRQSMEGK